MSSGSRKRDTYDHFHRCFSWVKESNYVEARILLSGLILDHQERLRDHNLMVWTFL